MLYDIHICVNVKCHDDGDGDDDDGNGNDGMYDNHSASSLAILIVIHRLTYTIISAGKAHAIQLINSFRSYLTHVE